MKTTGGGGSRRYKINLLFCEFCNVLMAFQVLSVAALMGSSSTYQLHEYTIIQASSVGELC